MGIIDKAKGAAEGIAEKVADLTPKAKIRAWLDACPGPMVWIAAYGPAVWSWVRPRLPFFGKAKPNPVPQSVGPTLER